MLANGFYVTAELSLVAIRRSRVAELVKERRSHAAALQRATYAHLATTQLGITISSPALSWIGEPALAHLIEPAFSWLPADGAGIGAHTLAIAISFVVTTALLIVLGELAPKSLALQRSERTALAVVRPLTLFLFVFRRAILFLNGLGTGDLRLVACNRAPGTRICPHRPGSARSSRRAVRRAFCTTHRRTPSHASWRSAIGASARS